ncbi:MAG: type II secretion system protein [Acidimicrobiales bacterium]
MVVLLIMAILLAIAIPTFLGVTGGAKRTAAWSNLTTSVTSAQSIYTNNSGSFPSTNTIGTPVHEFVTDLSKTQTTITYENVRVNLAGSAYKGKNVVGVFALGKVAFFMAMDGATVCWSVVANESSTPVTIGTGVHLQSGNHFFGWKSTGSSTTECTVLNALAALKRTSSKWTTGFAAVPGHLT